jgi:hypothetical protein
MLHVHRRVRHTCMPHIVFPQDNNTAHTSRHSYRPCGLAAQPAQPFPGNAQRAWWHGACARHGSRACTPAHHQPATPVHGPTCARSGTPAGPASSVTQAPDPPPAPPRPEHVARPSLRNHGWPGRPLGCASTQPGHPRWSPAPRRGQSATPAHEARKPAPAPRRLPPAADNTTTAQTMHGEPDEGLARS